MKATFVLSNAVPQKPGVNRGKWAQLEGAIHDLAAAHATVWIVIGPVCAEKTPKTIGPDKVAVPTRSRCVRPRQRRQADVCLRATQHRQAQRHHRRLHDLREASGETHGLAFSSALPADEQARLEKTANTLPGKL